MFVHPKIELLWSYSLFGKKLEANKKNHLLLVFIECSRNLPPGNRSNQVLIERPLLRQN